MNLLLGYAYATTYAGIRQVEKDDLALIVTGLPANAAAVFTQNLVQAAPVRLGRRHLQASKGLVGARVVTNAGATRTGDASASDAHRQQRACGDLRPPVTLPRHASGHLGTVNLRFMPFPGMWNFPFTMEVFVAELQDIYHND